MLTWPHKKTLKKGWIRLLSTLTFLMTEKWVTKAFLLWLDHSPCWMSQLALCFPLCSFSLECCSLWLRSFSMVYSSFRFPLKCFFSDTISDLPSQIPSLSSLEFPQLFNFSVYFNFHYVIINCPCVPFVLCSFPGFEILMVLAQMPIDMRASPGLITAWDKTAGEVLLKI